MTDREAMLQNGLLVILSNQGKPRTEVFVHAQLQATLGAAFTAAEITTAFQRAQAKGFVTGLPNADERLEWRITSEGRHHLVQ